MGNVKENFVLQRIFLTDIFIADIKFSFSLTFLAAPLDIKATPTFIIIPVIDNRGAL